MSAGACVISLSEFVLVYYFCVMFSGYDLVRVTHSVMLYITSDVCVWLCDCTLVI